MRLRKIIHCCLNIIILHIHACYNTTLLPYKKIRKKHVHTISITKTPNVTQLVRDGLEYDKIIEDKTE